MEAFGVLALWFVSVVWVYKDATTFERGGVPMSIRPGFWAVGVLLLWIIFFPLYLISRFGYSDKLAYIKIEKQRKRSQSKPTSRFKCPECGESIALEAKFCRFCNAIITSNDKPKKRIPQTRR